MSRGILPPAMPQILRLSRCQMLCPQTLPSLLLLYWQRHRQQNASLIHLLLWRRPPLWQRLRPGPQPLPLQYLLRRLQLPVA